MPNFADVLKEAKTGRVQVLHEFLTNFDPAKNRLHCFYEAREDEIFYRSFITPRTQARLFPYLCGNKDEVYAVFASVGKHRGYGQALFFVDKDLSDILKEARSMHARLFVTRYYSIENYLVSEEVLRRFCNDFIQCRGVVCDHEQSCADFTKALSAFYKLVLPIMAWIVAVRRIGQRPNLRNINLKVFLGFDEHLQVVRLKKRHRLAVLCNVTGAAPAAGLVRDLRKALMELRSHDPKSVVRGHFEAWFLVEYLKALFETLRLKTRERGGAATLIPAVEHSSFVPLAVPVISIPPDIDAFLAQNI